MMSEGVSSPLPAICFKGFMRPGPDRQGREGEHRMEEHVHIVVSSSPLYMQPSQSEEILVAWGKNACTIAAQQIQKKEGHGQGIRPESAYASPRYLRLLIGKRASACIKRRLRGSA